MAEVDNDWLLGTGNNNHGFIGKGDSDQLIVDMGNQQVVNSVGTVLEAQWSFDSIAQQYPLAQPDTQALAY